MASSLTAPWNNSGVLTADAEGQGLMTIGDFYETDLAEVRLILLTACESARSEFVDLASEQLGVPSAVLAMGQALWWAASGEWRICRPLCSYGSSSSS
jgi:hypothetical protein